MRLLLFWHDCCIEGVVPCLDNTSTQVIVWSRQGNEELSKLQIRLEQLISAI